MESSNVTVRPVVLPAAMTDSNAGDFAAMVDVRNAVETQILGADALSVTAAELLPMYHNQTYETRLLFLGCLDGKPVGRAVLGWSRTANSTVSTLNVEVMQSSRNQGVGTALLRHVEQRAVESQHAVFQSDVLHPLSGGGERIPSPSGFGDLPADDPGVLFLRRHGYELQLVARVSFLELPVDGSRLDPLRIEAQARAGSRYRLHGWIGMTPEEWLGDIGHLKSRMIVEEPAGGLDVVEQVWDPERVRKRDATIDGAGRVLVTGVVEDIASGRLIGVTELDIPADRSRPVGQGDTLVLPGHRGHRLGMLLKIDNLHRLTELNPQSRLVYTFNAEENRPMLDVNESLGFHGVGVEGSWRKAIRPQPAGRTTPAS